MEVIEPGDVPSAPPSGWATGPLGQVQAADREIARQTARRARAVADFAANRPASADRSPGQPGCMSADRRAARPEVLADVSEWATQELALALSITEKAAEDLLSRSLTLAHRLPRSLDALERGLLNVGHLWALLEKVAPVTDLRVRALLERDLLRWVAAREVTTPAHLRAKITRELLARNARSVARELEAAVRRRGVHARPDRVSGMAVLSALLTVPEADALLDALGRYADALDDGDGPPRTRGQKMVDCLLDLVLRAGETHLAPVQALVTLVVPVATMVGGDAPGEIGGQPVPAETVRALARALGLLPDAPPPDAPPPDAPAVVGADVLAGDPEGEALERWWAEVEARALRGEWGGEEAPPPEELHRIWQSAARCSEWDEPTVSDMGSELVTGGEPETDESPEWWAAADRLVEEAGAAVAELDRRLARARRAVQMAEIADHADEEAWQHSPAALPTSAPDALAALVHTGFEQREALGQLLLSSAGGGLADRPRIALTDAMTGALLALTDARGLRAAATCARPSCRTGRTACIHDPCGPGLGPPGPCRTYRPGAALDRFLRARDRRCRFPGCRNRVPHGGELDHHRRWPEGPTAAGNLTGFCTRHHRGKHQAPGWQYDQSEDGTLTVRTPTGLTASTTPPPF